MTNTHRRWILDSVVWSLSLLFAFGLLADNALADSKAFAASNKTWQAECASCHIAYPPNLLPAPAWRRMMAGLDQHFGTDASVDPKTAATIGAFLEANAGRERSGKPEAAVLRITATRWFGHEHSGKAAATWKAGWIKSPADCAACHRQAANGDFGERTLRLPQ